jgi:3-oxoacyl-[acyl-carrier protein] reductase
MAYDLREKVALVTGSSRGIGRAIAERLARDGAAVIVNYFANEEAAADTVETITAAGGKARALKADVSSVNEIDRLLKEAEAAFGRLDIVVANAATAVIGPFVDMSEQQYDTVFNTNTKGVFFTMQQAARRLREHGRIIVVTTGGVKMILPGNALYLGSKGSLAQFVRTLAQELGSRKITVNALLPGYTDTDLLPDRDRAVAATASPFKRIGTPDDVAAAAAFLASDDARWVTGQELGAGGGVF